MEIPMPEAKQDSPEVTPKKSKLSLILGIVMAIAGACGGFFLVRSDALSLGNKSKKASHSAESIALDDVAFVEVEPITVSLMGERETVHLRFRAQLEVDSDDKRAVTKILPRISDVLNGYLRALELKDFRDPLALMKLRSQILRRVQVVTGPDQVRDLLIMEFVLN
jgi:flagellar FliL protein